MKEWVAPESNKIQDTQPNKGIVPVTTPVAFEPVATLSVVREYTLA
jgi:hypothetical protein